MGRLFGYYYSNLLALILCVCVCEYAKSFMAGANLGI